MLPHKPKEPRPYAAGTKVPVSKTTAEIGALLEKIGASQRGTMVDDEQQCAVVAFVLSGAKYRIDVPLPRFRADASKYFKSQAERDRATRDHEQAIRARWRGVLLLLRAKIEAVRLGLSSFEKEFMADMVLPNGRTVQESIPEIIRNGLAGRAVPQLGDGRDG